MNQLELALIELEYARADFAQRREATVELRERAELESFLVKLALADLALQIAIRALARPPWTPDANRLN